MRPVKLLRKPIQDHEPSAAVRRGAMPVRKIMIRKTVAYRYVSVEQASRKTTSKGQDA